MSHRVEVVCQATISNLIFRSGHTVSKPNIAQAKALARCLVSKIKCYIGVEKA